MKIARFGTLIALILTAGSLLAQQTPPPSPKPQATPPAVPEKPAFPPVIAKALDDVILSGVDRIDTHLKYIKTLYMPSVPGKVQAVLIFEMFPANLKLAVVAPPVPGVPATPASSASKPAAPAAPATPAAPGQPPTPPAAPPAPIRVDVFLRLTRADATGAFVPYDDIGLIYLEPEEQATGYAMYTVSLPMDPGSYKLLMAIADEKLEKVATTRTELVLPDPSVVKGSLETTPIIFANSIKQLDPSAREMRATVRKGDFMFSVLDIQPKLDNIFAVGDSKEIFYFVFGGRPDLNLQPPKFNLEVTYTLKKGNESVIKFAKQAFPMPLINHPLPLQMQEKDKTLAPGLYSLAIDIQDKVGDGKLKTEIPIEIK